jgi:hypothetical protein
MLLKLLKYFKRYIEISNQQTSSKNIIPIQLKKRKVTYEQCRTEVNFHGLGRIRKVLIGENQWIVYYVKKR